MIVIGASLGGTQALREVFACLPARLPVALAVVLHRQRDSDGGLAALLGRDCPMPVLEPFDKDPILPGRIYLAPADYHLLVEPDHFSLSVDEPVQYARPSIDVLFESAVEAQGDKTIGVILTGANQDGARGAQAIRQAGGVLLVQDPASAECGVMPEAAISRAGADYVLPLGPLGETLARLARGVRREAP